MQNYGVSFLLEKNKPVLFSDFTIEYLGDRKVAVPKYTGKHFIYRDYKLTVGGDEKIISWTNGTGELIPLEFEIGGKKYTFQPWGIDFAHKEISILEK